MEYQDIMSLQQWKAYLEAMNDDEHHAYDPTDAEEDEKDLGSDSGLSFSIKPCPELKKVHLSKWDSFWNPSWKLI